MFGLATGSLGTATPASPLTMVPLPPSIDTMHASSVPTVFATVAAAFEQACVSASSNVLVHAATGGVGLAALQLCASIGAQPMGTAGTASKRALLRRDGVLRAASSRSHAFAAELALTGTLPDALVNSLTSGGMVAASLALLATGGSLVELGKRDIWSPQRVAQERPDVAFNLLALDFMPERCLHGALLRVASGLCLADVQPLPLVVYPLHKAQGAMRQLAQARHVGKVVVHQAELDFAAHGTTMITGGLGGLGRRVACWLAEEGAQHLVLTGTTGRRPELSKLVQEGPAHAMQITAARYV